MPRLLGRYTCKPLLLGSDYNGKGRCQKYPEVGGSLKFVAESRKTLTPLKILQRTCTPHKLAATVKTLPFQDQSMDPLNQAKITGTPPPKNDA